MSERVDTMFTLEQINAIHDQLGNAESLTQYVEALSAIGVETYDSYIMDGHSAYVGRGGHTVISAPAHELLTIADTSDKAAFLKHLDLHNQGKTSYLVHVCGSSFLVRRGEEAKAVASSRPRIIASQPHRDFRIPVLEMSQGLAESGIAKWTVDTKNMTMTFYDKAEDAVLAEVIV